MGVILERIKSEWHKKRRLELQREIAVAEKSGARERVDMLLKELQLL